MSVAYVTIMVEKNFRIVLKDFICGVILLCKVKAHELKFHVHTILKNY